MDNRKEHRKSIVWWCYSVLLVALNCINLLRGGMLLGIFEKNLVEMGKSGVKQVSELPESILTQTENLFYTYPGYGVYITPDASIVVAGMPYEGLFEAGLGFAVFGSVLTSLAILVWDRSDTEKVYGRVWVQRLLTAGYFLANLVAIIWAGVVFGKTGIIVALVVLTLLGVVPFSRIGGAYKKCSKLVGSFRGKQKVVKTGRKKNKQKRKIR